LGITEIYGCSSREKELTLDCHGFPSGLEQPANVHRESSTKPLKGGQRDVYGAFLDLLIVSRVQTRPLCCFLLAPAAS
jgi:hypothetical protein